MLVIVRSSTGSSLTLLALQQTVVASHVEPEPSEVSAYLSCTLHTGGTYS